MKNLMLMLLAFLMPINAFLQPKKISLRTLKNVTQYINNGGDLEDVDEKFYNDKNLILKSISNFPGWDPATPTLPKYVSSELLNDNTFVKKMLCLNGEFLQFLSDEQRRDKQLVLCAVSQNGMALEFANSVLKNDKDVVLDAVKENEFAIEFASQELKSDKEVFLTALKRSPLSYYAIKFADSSLILNRNFLIEAVKINGRVLDEIQDYYSYDVELLLEATKNGCRLKNTLCEKLSENQDVALKLVEYSPKLYYSLCEKAKENKNVATLALKSHQIPIDSLPKNLLYDDDFRAQIEILLKDKNNLLEAIRKYGLPTVNFDTKHKFDREVAIASFKKDCMYLGNFSHDIQCDEKVVFAAITTCSGDMRSVCPELKKNEKFLLKAFEVNPNLIHFLPEKYRKNKDYVLMAIKYNKRSIKAVHSSLLLEDDLYDIFLEN